MARRMLFATIVIAALGNTVAADKAKSVSQAKSSPDSKVEPPLPPAKREAAHALFEAASELAAKGELQSALSKYLRLYKIVPHYDIAYNIATIREALGDLENAADSFESYLTENPTISRGEKASLTKKVGQLRTTPGLASVQFRTEFGKKPIVFIDGIPAYRESGTVTLTPGRHHFDAISEVGFRSESWAIGPGRHLPLDTILNEKDGNFILSGSHVVSKYFQIKGLRKNSLYQRFNQAPGPTTIELTGGKCSFSQDIVIPAQGVHYLFISVTPMPALRADGKPKRFYELEASECGTADFKFREIDFAMKLPDVKYDRYSKIGTPAPKAGAATTLSND